jgi:hypothetical protein
MFQPPSCYPRRASWRSPQTGASSCPEEAEGFRFFRGLCIAIGIEAGIGAIVSALISSAEAGVIRQPAVPVTRLIVQACLNHRSRRRQGSYR